MRFLKRTFRQINHLRTIIFGKYFLLYQLIYIFLLLFASINVYSTIFTNLLLFIVLNVLCYNSYSSITHLNSLVTCMLIGNYVTFQVMVYAYREIVAWELVLIILFYVLIPYYLIYLVNKTTIIKLNHRITSMRCKLLNCDLNVNEQTDLASYVKCLLLIIVASLYTTQLTVTTICTPLMKFDWLLVPNKCDLMYIDWFSAICTSCAFLSLNLAIFTIIYTIVQINKLRNM